MRQRHSQGYALISAEIAEVLSNEIGAIISDDAMRYAISVDDALDELNGTGRIRLHDRLGFNPLCELVYAMRRCLKPSGVVFWGPTISRPHTAKGHVRGIILSG